MRLATAGVATEAADALAALDEAGAHYRGEFLDDCPFYGDSEFVEERRAGRRARRVDLLLALDERYEERGDDCPRADAGLARLGLAA